MSQRSTDSYALLPARGANRKMRWLNGGGWTREIIAWPHRDSWEWRLSVADIEQDGPFSVFPDVDRTIALLQGSGFALSVEYRPPVTIQRPYEPFHFRGDEPAACTLLNGPVQDLNLMVRRSSPPLHLRFIEVVDTVELVNIELALVVSGRVKLGGHFVERLDAFRPATTGQTSVLSAPNSKPATIAIITDGNG